MAVESGGEYLRKIAEQYDTARRVLPTLPEDEFEKVRREQNRKEIGVESFLMDLAIGAETRKRNLERWAVGRTITPASAEHASAIISALPAYTTVNPEALGAMRVEASKKFRLDIVVEDILTEIAQRLPRAIDAYRYHQDYAEDSIDIPGLGQVKVTMLETGDGIFRTIGTVDNDLFRIWNCRSSGVKYMDRYNDISKPEEISVKALNKKIKLSRDADVADFRQTEDEMIIWLAENVLNPLRTAPKPDRQATEKPEEEPFPEGKIGPLYTFIKEEVLRKIALIRGNPSKAYPDERKAVSPSWRLVPVGTPLRGASRIAYDGFVWCGVGEMNEESASEPNMEIGLVYKHTGFSEQEGVAVINPKTATDVYVVDWQARNEVREQFRLKALDEGRDRFTDDEVGDIEIAVAKTLVSITEYKGEYKKPIVLIGRDLEIDEIEAAYLPS